MYSYDTMSGNSEKSIPWMGEQTCEINSLVGVGIGKVAVKVGVNVGKGELVIVGGASVDSGTSELSEHPASRRIASMSKW